MTLIYELAVLLNAWHQVKIQSLSKKISLCIRCYVRFAKKLFARCLPMVILLLSLPICMALDKTVRKMFSKLVKTEDVKA